MKISIITINYNDAVGLEKTILSVINQSYKAVEYFVIDGGSKDGSVAVIQKYPDKIDYWLSEPDSGIFNAMNKGIVKATGDYLLFLNSGDVLTNENALQDFICHEQFQGDIIYGDYKFENGSKIYPDKLTPLFFFKSSLPHQSTFFKKEVFAKMGMYNEVYKIVSDREFFIKCFFSNQFKFQHINYELTLFDLSGISNDEKQLEKKKAEDHKVFLNHFNLFYDDYRLILKLQSELNQEKRKSIKGIMKRIKNKIIKLCRIR